MKMSDRNHLLIALQNELMELVAIKVADMEKIFDTHFTKDDVLNALKAVSLASE